MVNALKLWLNLTDSKGTSDVGGVTIFVAAPIYNEQFPSLKRPFGGNSMG
jgi:hypothetical protein